MNNNIYFVNRNFYVVAHLIERLEELVVEDITDTLLQRLNDGISALKAQTVKIRRVFAALDAAESYALAQPVVALLESVFTKIREAEPSINETYLYDYIYLADTIMAGASNLVVTGGELENIYDPSDLKPLLDFLADSLNITVEAN